jgi:DNA-binding CsgD family transcriptional regulator
MNRTPARMWTSQEVNMIEQLYSSGVRPSQIAARTGATRHQIEALLIKLGTQRTHRAPSGLEELPRESQMAELLSRGFDMGRIARIMGYKDRQTANAAFQRLRRHMGPQAR